MTARRAAVLGSPIAHSLSPALHSAAYRALGLTGWSYQAIECDEQRLPTLLGSLGPEWAGLSLTMPLKRAVLPLLDRADDLVGVVGAANTVVLQDGRRVGYNTDVAGIVTAVRQAGVHSSGNAAILGGGATACSALAALAQMGATDVRVLVRDPGRTTGLLEVASRLGVAVRLTEIGSRPAGPAAEAADLAGDVQADLAADVPDLAADVPDLAADGPAARRWELLISTVPAGAADAVAGLLAAGTLRADAVLDVVYDPWPTRLATAAARAGATVISGFEMLVHQAAGQVELMTGLAAPTEAMRSAGHAELDRRRR